MNSIWNYTYENWSENQADKYYAPIKFVCQEIGINPELGKVYNEISQNLRGLKSGKHIKFYSLIYKVRLKLLEYYTKEWI
ncbi:type II toxin-antitoxin system RelE/ParE family toxin [uncultured Polaribacter sp.]|uniref:type II toxin-antitoxin system RelE/ParE family toxin n=1 Tax=uncultured Polaribacter sp. TaxID=174711 RepID=UPI00344246B7